MVLLVLTLAGCGAAVAHRPAAHAPQPEASSTAGTVATAPREPRSVLVRHTRARATRSRAKPTPRFRYEALELTPGLRRQLERTSWHLGCPVALGQLRYLRIGYWGFDRRAHLGEMVVNASAIGGLRRAFAALFAAKFPIRQMRLVDRYGGSDYASIQADNTSAFNCRDATGSSRFSEHAYGLAIDINPIENPYVYANGTTTHPASDPYLDRANVRPGMAVRGGTLVRAFAAIGWGWGGRWPLPTDFQHFSVNGR
jgi:D-alanyl-D-alanine carboxypeptidase